MRKCTRCEETLGNTRFEFDDVDICMDCGDEMREIVEEVSFLTLCIDPDLDN